MQGCNQSLVDANAKHDNVPDRVHHIIHNTAKHFGNQLLQLMCTKAEIDSYVNNEVSQHSTEAEKIIAWVCG